MLVWVWNCWNSLVVMLLDKHTSGSFGKDMSPTSPVGGEFNCNMRWIKRVDKCPSWPQNTCLWLYWVTWRSSTSYNWPVWRGCLCIWSFILDGKCPMFYRSNWNRLLWRDITGMRLRNRNGCWAGSRGVSWGANITDWMVNIWIWHFPLEKFLSSLTLWIQHWNTSFLVSAAIHTLEATGEPCCRDRRQLENLSIICIIIKQWVWHAFILLDQLWFRCLQRATVIGRWRFCSLWWQFDSWNEGRIGHFFVCWIKT